MQIGLGFLFIGIVLLMSSISPQLTSPLFSVSLALFGQELPPAHRPVGVPEAVISLVVRQNKVEDFRILGKRAQDVETEPGVRLHHATFFGGQLAWLQQDRVRDPDLSDVVNLGRELDQGYFGRAEAELAGDRTGVLGHPL